jgi:hypothetical protein
MNIYSELQKLAKSNKYMNLFTATKEMAGIRLFRNKYDLSSIQSIFLNYLYNFELINREIVTEKISKHVLDNEIMWTSYLLWRQKNQPKQKEEVKEKNKAVKLVAGTKINFSKDKS